MSPVTSAGRDKTPTHGGPASIVELNNIGADAVLDAIGLATIAAKGPEGVKLRLLRRQPLS
jgi:hypothetical protein